MGDKNKLVERKAFAREGANFKNESLLCIFTNRRVIPM